MFFTLLKLYEWYQITQSTTFLQNKTSLTESHSYFCTIYFQLGVHDFSLKYLKSLGSWIFSKLNFLYYHWPQLLSLRFGALWKLRPACYKAHFNTLKTKADQVDRHLKINRDRDRRIAVNHFSETVLQKFCHKIYWSQKLILKNSKKTS